MKTKSIKPNYKDGSILNLMSSIGKALGKKSKYNALKILDPKELKTTNLIVLVLDGVGYNFFKKHGSKELKKFLRGKITSTFPSATGSAMTSLSTGLSSLDHEMTGWFVYLKEFGNVTLSLPYRTRLHKKGFLEKIFPISKIYTLTPFTKGIKCDSYYLYPKVIVNSAFSKAIAGKSKRKSFTTIKSHFSEIKKIVNKNKKKKFIFSYYPEHDGLCHKYGSKSRKVIKHFNQLEKELLKFLKKLEDSTVIITADHGIIDIPRTKVIDLKDHPRLKETLRLPLCGDPRYAYCYVKPDKVKEFKEYVKNNLKHCKLYKSENLIKKNYFGLTTPSKRFLERIGDYIIMMKENHSIYDFLENQKPDYNIGDHGGLSDDEMLVPLIVVKK
tara:strand:- start:277 stop:1431 length:1155 start_codon:yes stop_codon:yes gene_type:complete